MVTLYFREVKFPERRCKMLQIVLALGGILSFLLSIYSLWLFKIPVPEPKKKWVTLGTMILGIGLFIAFHCQTLALTRGKSINPRHLDKNMIHMVGGQVPTSIGGNIVIVENARGETWSVENPPLPPRAHFVRSVESPEGWTLEVIIAVSE